MKKRLFQGKWVACIVISLALMGVGVWVFAKTTVTKTGPCDVTVEVNLAIHGPEASQEVADRWQENISNAWNGPSHALAMRIAQDNNLNPKRDRNRINDLAKDFLKKQGFPENCAYVNCCNICFKITVRLLSDVQNDPNDKKPYHRIKVVPNYKTEIKDGVPRQVWNRSFVRGLRGQSASTTGQWRNDAAERIPPEAHETGHIMGAKDTYHDGPDGKVVRDEGHDYDLMANQNGWPFNDCITDILKIGGVECDCCDKSLNRYYQDYGRVFWPATDSILTCNIEVLKQADMDVTDQLANLKGKKVPPTLIYDLIQLRKKIRKAIEDCKKRGVITTPRTTDGVTTGEGTAVDSSSFCQYWGTDTPLTPVTTPPTTPTTTPPTTPTTPTPTPPTTPGTPTVEKPPAITQTPPTTPLFPDGKPPTIVTTRIPGPGEPTPPPSVPKEPKKPKKPTPTPTGPPTPVYTYKVVRSVLKKTGQAMILALPGARTRVTLPVPALPLAGAKKDDSGSGADPITGHTDQNGEVTLGAKKQPGSAGGPAPRLALGPQGFLDGSVVSDAHPMSEAEAMMLARAEPAPKTVEIVLPAFRSYIVKLKLNKSLRDWNNPSTYLKDKTLKPYLMRHWIVGESMYLVFNFPIVEEK